MMFEHTNVFIHRGLYSRSSFVFCIALAYTHERPTSPTYRQLDNVSKVQEKDLMTKLRVKNLFTVSCLSNCLSIHLLCTSTHIVCFISLHQHLYVDLKRKLNVQRELMIGGTLFQELFRCVIHTSTAAVSKISHANITEVY